MSVLIIDHFDSFVFNLVRMTQELNCDVDVVRYDAFDPNAVNEKYSHVILSPGPMTPDHIPKTIALLQKAYFDTPLLGVCLGHQAIAAAYRVNCHTYAAPQHGKTDQVFHQQRGVFKGLPSPFTVTRYHSLHIEAPSETSELEVTAVNGQEMIMGIQHKTKACFGVQFHPEAYLTEYGYQLLENFLKCTG